MATKPVLTDPPVAPSRADSANFDQRADTFLGWFATAWSNLRAMLTFVDEAAVAAAASASSAASNASAAGTSAATASTKAGEASTSAQQAATNASSATSSAATASTKAAEAAGSATSAATSAASAANASRLAIGTVTSLPPTGTASATISGNAGAQTLNLGLVKGDTGAKGDKGDQGPSGGFEGTTTSAVGGGFAIAPTPAITSYAIGQQFSVRFNGPASSGTLNVSGLGAKALKQYNTTGTKVNAVIKAGQLATVVFDGVDFVLRDALPPFVPPVRQIQDLEAGILSGDGVLSIFWTPQPLDFRTSIQFPDYPSAWEVERAVATSVAEIGVPAGATLGAGWGKQRLMVLAVHGFGYNGGIELAVTNASGGINLDETQLINTVQISPSANLASVIYSTGAYSNVPYRVIGFIDVSRSSSGWSNPTLVQGAGGQALAAMGSFGFGQKLSANLYGSSRTYGTTYYNTKGKPITVYIATSSTAGCILNIYINGQAMLLPMSGPGGSGYFSFVVPPGASYSILCANGVPASTIWHELS